MSYRIKRCKKCVLPNTRPGIKFDEEGICFPCKQFEKRSKIDWDSRWRELEDLCRKHKRNDGYYDCLITVSGGKDSHFQVYLFKKLLNMNPLCFMIDNTAWTKTGRKNFYNISETFGVDMLTFTADRKKAKELSRKGFFEELHPSKYWDVVLYKKPLEIAKKLRIPLVIWGENVGVVNGGSNYEETPNALCLTDIETQKEFSDLDVIFTSYYVRWSRFDNVKIAKKFGFKSLKDTGEWSRRGLEDFDYEQVDTKGYLINQYCKFIKFGFSSITEFCSDAIRHGKMTREEAIKQVNEDDWIVDSRMLSYFCKELDLTWEDFWKTIEKFVNNNILEKRQNHWKLRKDAV